MLGEEALDILKARENALFAGGATGNRGCCRRHTEFFQQTVIGKFRWLQLLFHADRPATVEDC